MTVTENTVLTICAMGDTVPQTKIAELTGTSAKTVSDVRAIKGLIEEDEWDTLKERIESKRYQKNHVDWILQYMGKSMPAPETNDIQTECLRAILVEMKNLKEEMSKLCVKVDAFRADMNLNFDMNTKAVDEVKNMTETSAKKLSVKLKGVTNGY